MIQWSSQPYHILRKAERLTKYFEGIGLTLRT